MKRQISEVGVKKWSNAELQCLGDQPLEAIDGIFAQYGECVLSGVAITDAEGGLFNLSQGLVAIRGKNAKDKESAMVVPFAGAISIALPIYLTLGYNTENRLYADGKNKPIAYEYYAKPSSAKPTEASYLEITRYETKRYNDALQDPTHRFVTDTEIAQWSAKETVQASQAKATAALTAANSHTAATATTLRGEIATSAGAAKSYTDTKVASVLDSAPETLDTLNELAAALGDDPNFATTVATQIGSKVSTDDPRLSDARPASGGAAKYLQWTNPTGGVYHDHYLKFIRANPVSTNARLYLQGGNVEYDTVQVAYADNANSATNIGGHSADDLFISNGADRADINNLPEHSGMWAVNGDMGGSNTPFQYGAVVQFAGASGGGGNPVLQIASRFYGNHFYVRSKWHNESLATNGWLELYHSGNFNPAAKVDSSDPRLTDARPADGGVAKYLQWTNPTGDVYHDHYLKFTRTNPASANARLYLQGGNVEYDTVQVAFADNATTAENLRNFNPETKANTNDVMKVLRAGKVKSDGQTKKSKGWFQSQRLGSMIYRVTHEIGHTNYITFATCVHSNQVHDISVISETANYTEFLIGGTSGTSFSAFNFTILEI